MQTPRNRVDREGWEMHFLCTLVSLFLPLMFAILTKMCYKVCTQSFNAPAPKVVPKGQLCIKKRHGLQKKPFNATSYSFRLSAMSFTCTFRQTGQRARVHVCVRASTDMQNFYVCILVWVTSSNLVRESVAVLFKT